jgi:hypothetical protein
MTKIILTAVAAAAILTAGLVTPNRVEATALGMAAANLRLAAETVDPVTNVRWWWGHRHHGYYRAYAFYPVYHHRFHRCWRCW